MSNNSILKITPKFILSLVDKVQVLKYKKSSRNSVTNRIKKSTENNNYYHCHTVIFSSLLHVVNGRDNPLKREVTHHFNMCNKTHVYKNKYEFKIAFIHLEGKDLHITKYTTVRGA